MNPTIENALDSPPLFLHNLFSDTMSEDSFGPTLTDAFYNLFTHTASGSTVNQSQHTYICTMVRQITELCTVFWNLSKDILEIRGDPDLDLKNPDSVSELLHLLSSTVRRGHDVLRDLQLDSDALLLAYEEGDLETNIKDFYAGFVALISSVEDFCRTEEWASHKLNHVSSTDGGGGVGVIERKVKLYMTLLFLSFDLQVFDRLHNSGGDSKAQISEQCVAGCARLTSYDCDLSATDGVACSVASSSDLAGRNLGATEWHDSHLADLLRLAHKNAGRFQKAVHGQVGMGAVIHCEHWPGPERRDETLEYDFFISEPIDALISEAMKDRSKPMHASLQRLTDFRKLHSVEQPRLRLAFDKHLCNIKGEQCTHHEASDERHPLNIGIMLKPKAKGVNEVTKRFEYEDVSTAIISSIDDIDDFDKNIPAIIIADEINRRSYDWFFACWDKIRHLHSSEPKWPTIDWAPWVSETLQLWLQTFGFSREQLERTLVHHMHLKSFIVKMKKEEKKHIKALLDSESDFILEHSAELLQSHASFDSLNINIQAWISAKAEQLGITDLSLRKCAEEVTTSLLNGSDRNALDSDWEDDADDADIEQQTYCVCAQHYDEEREWIKCPLCDESYHRECVGLTFQEWHEQLDLDVMSWTCMHCMDSDEANSD